LTSCFDQQLMAIKSS